MYIWYLEGFWGVRVQTWNNIKWNRNEFIMLSTHIIQIKTKNQESLILWNTPSWTLIPAMSIHVHLYRQIAHPPKPKSFITAWNQPSLCYKNSSLDGVVHKGHCCNAREIMYGVVAVSSLPNGGGILCCMCRHTTLWSTPTPLSHSLLRSWWETVTKSKWYKDGDNIRLFDQRCFLRSKGGAR